jgi:hypothetical protein
VRRWIIRHGGYYRRRRGPAGERLLHVEFTPQGKFVAQFQVDPGSAGAAFGLAVGGDFQHLRFAAVNDNQNQLDIWNIVP